MTLPGIRAGGRRTFAALLWMAGLVYPFSARAQIPPALAHPAPGSLASIVVDDSDRALVTRLIRVQDAHAIGPASLATIGRALRSRNAAIRRIAVQAAGRLERAEFITDIATAMADPGGRSPFRGRECDGAGGDPWRSRPPPGLRS